MKTLHIVIATIFQNGGDATRALEIAKIIQKTCPEDIGIKITFISRGSRYEQEAIALGFEVFHARPKLEGIRFQDDFHTKFGDLIGDSALAKEILQGEIEAYQTLKPDLLLYGFWPIGSIAHRLAIPDIKAIAFLPLPLTEAFMQTVRFFPDELPLARLPAKVQAGILTAMPQWLKLRNPALRHPSIARAAKALGWQGEPLHNIFTMLRPDLYLVNDFSLFYNVSLFQNKVIFTGPLYAQTKEDTRIEDEAIRAFLAPDNSRPKIFGTLGSSGNKAHLLEIIKIFNSGAGQNWSGLILSPKAICPLDEARAALNNNHVYITDQFVPAKTINQQVDLVVCHGGQGTLQTAITSGTPLVGIATQPEQKINLHHLTQFGMAISLPHWHWNSATIQQSVTTILASPSYKEKAQVLQKQAGQIKTADIIAKAIWQELAIG